MKSKPHNDAFWWTLFGAGGTLSALLLPIHLLLLGLALPLGWLAAPDYEGLRDLVLHPVTRIYLFVLVSLSLFHWAHRFRYTLYDGLQLKHLEIYIMILCYGSALAGTLLSAYLIIGWPSG